MRNLILLIFLATFSYGQEVVLSENFEKGIPEDWKVESSNKKRSWIHKTFRDQSYMQMSAYGGRGKAGYKVKTKLHTPLIQPTNKTCKLRFAFADAYENGQPLQVTLTDEKFKPLRSLPESFWQKLVNNSEKYDNVYENTEWIPLPDMTEPYHISFVYDSQKDNRIITTLIQLGEVDVWCE